MSRPIRAISIRQPYAELILRRIKKAEYRAVRTHLRERVYVYASAKPADDPAAWRKAKSAPGELPTSVVVGTVEIVGCRWDSRGGCWAYVLAKPRRPRRKLRPTNQPQPVFWKPRFR